MGAIIEEINHDPSVDVIIVDDVSDRTCDALTVCEALKTASRRAAPGLVLVRQFGSSRHHVATMSAEEPRIIFSGVGTAADFIPGSIADLERIFADGVSTRRVE